jgi:hypothetical protein
VGSCEHGNEPVGFIKCREFHDWLRECKFFKKAFFALSWLVGQLVLLCSNSVSDLILFNKGFMNGEEKDLEMVYLNFICFSKEFLNADEEECTNTIDSGVAPEEMF